MYEKPVIRELNMQTCSESDACNNTEEKHSVHKAWYINFFFFFFFFFTMDNTLRNMKYIQLDDT